jgi:ribosomal protein S18 acetylase RimI-like enzyme
MNAMKPMQLRTIQAGDGALLREVTLRSVEDAPYAFGGVGTLERERQRPGSEWDDLAAECGGDVEAWRDRCVGYLIGDGDFVCAKALAYLSRDGGVAFMSGVWVDPRHRRRGLGRWLVREACDWARSKAATQLMLWVDETNPGAAAFYEALGFRATGESRPVERGSVDLERSFTLALAARA